MTPRALLTRFWLEGQLEAPRPPRQPRYPEGLHTTKVNRQLSKGIAYDAEYIRLHRERNPRRGQGNGCVWRRTISTLRTHQARSTEERTGQEMGALRAQDGTKYVELERLRWIC